MTKINGIIPVLSTPMTASGDINATGLERLLEFLVSRNIGGLWVLGTGSEDMNLTFAKRLQVAEIATGVVDGRKPLLLGTSFYAMEESLAFMQKTKHLKKDGYHAMPYHPLLSEDGLKRYYTELADNSPAPFWLYTSGNWSLQLSLGAIEELKQHPNIAGMKFSSTNAVAAMNVIGLHEDSFQIITAVASQSFPSFCMGSKAHTSSLGSALPDPLIEIHDLYSQGRYEEALTAQRSLNAFLKVFSSGAKKDNFLMAAEEKYVLSLRGICEDYVSGSYRSLNNEEKKRIRGALAKHGYLDVAN